MIKPHQRHSLGQRKKLPSPPFRNIKPSLISQFFLPLLHYFYSNDIGMRKTIKFYQIIAPVIFSIMYATTIFGSEEPTLPVDICGLKVSSDICDLIYEYQGDGSFEETGYLVNAHDCLEPHSRALESITKNSPLIYLVLSVAIIFPTLFKKFPKIGFTLQNVLGSFFSTVSTVALIMLEEKVSELFPQKKSYLLKQFFHGTSPEKLDLSLSNIDSKDLCIKKCSNYFWDRIKILPKNETPSNYTEPRNLHFDKEKGVILENEIDILPTQEKITSCAFFKKENIIVTASKRGVFQWEFQRNPNLTNLYKIMNADTD